MSHFGEWASKCYQKSGDFFCHISVIGHLNVIINVVSLSPFGEWASKMLS